MAQSADANGQAGDVSNHYDRMAMAGRSDLIERNGHALQDLVSGFAVSQTNTVVTVDDPGSKNPRCQTTFPRIRGSVPTAHGNLGERRDSVKLQPQCPCDDRPSLP